MENLKPDYGKWRKILFQFNLIIAVCTCIVEIITYFFLKANDLIFQSLPVYFLLFFILPTILFASRWPFLAFRLC